MGEPLARIGVAEGDTAYQLQCVMGVLPLADGRLVRRVRFPPGFELHAVRAGRAYGVRTGDEGVQVVEVYAVER